MDHIASFQLKEIVVFLNLVFHVCILFHCMIGTKFELQPVQSTASLIV